MAWRSTRFSTVKLISARVKTPRALLGAGSLSHPIPKRLKMTSTVAPSSRGSSFALTEFLSNPPKTHSSFFAVSFPALMSCRMRRRGRNGLMRRVPRIDSDVVKTKRHRPERSGDSFGFGVGFSFSSAST